MKSGKKKTTKQNAVTKLDLATRANIVKESILKKVAKVITEVAMKLIDPKRNPNDPALIPINIDPIRTGTGVIPNVAGPVNPNVQRQTGSKAIEIGTTVTDTRTTEVNGIETVERIDQEKGNVERIDPHVTRREPKNVIHADLALHLRLW